MYMKKSFLSLNSRDLVLNDNFGSGSTYRNTGCKGCLFCRLNKRFSYCLRDMIRETVGQQLGFVPTQVMDEELAKVNEAVFRIHIDLNTDLDPVPDPAFEVNTDPDPASDPDPGIFMTKI